MVSLCCHCTPVPFCAEESSGRLLSLCECADTWDEHLLSGVLPSIHVYNSVAIHVAFAESHYFKGRNGWRIASFLLCTLICLSTMFLKQHSFLDVITAIMLYLVYYVLIYKIIPEKSEKRRQLSEIS